MWLAGIQVPPADGAAGLLQHHPHLWRGELHLQRPRGPGQQRHSPRSGGKHEQIKYQIEKLASDFQHFKTNFLSNTYTLWGKDYYIFYCISKQEISDSLSKTSSTKETLPTFFKILSPNFDKVCKLFSNIL